MCTATRYCCCSSSSSKFQLEVKKNSRDVPFSEQKGSSSPGTTKDAPDKNHLKPAISVAITEATSTAPGLNQEEDPYSALAVRKRKYDTRWKQQKNLAVRQNFTLINILILYLAIGIIFMCFGIICYFYARAYPNVLIEDYTHCPATRDNTTSTTTPTTSQNETETMSNECFPGERSRNGIHPLNISKSIYCTCEIKIKVDNSALWKLETVLYFELSKFHQNIRRYKKDVDWDQLAGHAVVNGKAAFTKCKYPYFNATNNKYIFPCGKVANSYFSDEFKLFDGKGREQRLNQEGISWESDKHRFVNPKGLDNLTEIQSKFDLPRDWHDGLKQDFLTENEAYGRGIENEHFIVWMRPAALSDFRKKYAYLPVLEKGEYTMLIQYRYEVKSYKGTKKFIIAADSKDRPKDYFFFYVYLLVSVYCLLVGPLLWMINWVLKKMDKRKSHSQAINSASSTDTPQTTTDTEAESGRSSALQMTTTDAPNVTSSEHPSTSGGSTKSFFGFGR